MKKILMMAGGTGGHVYPALAVAKELAQLGYEIHWIGNADGFEYSHVTAAGYRFHDIQMRGIRGNISIKTPFMITKALFRACCVLREVQPCLAIGMGGFVSAPAGFLAKFFKIPLVIHEQNAAVGLANRKLAPVAKKFLLGNREALNYLQARGYDLLGQIIVNESIKQKKGIVLAPIFTGNPVRANIAVVATPDERFAERSGKIKLLILGGSQGASALNTLIPQALKLIPEPERPEVMHQVGVKNVVETEKMYAENGVTAEIVPFIEDIAKAYGTADWVLARSGALTVAEISTVGVSALFVPFPHAVDDHQFLNAQDLVKKGAAAVIRQEELTPELLAVEVQKRTNRQELLKQAQLARSLSQAEALNKIVKEIKELL